MKCEKSAKNKHKSYMLYLQCKDDHQETILFFLNINNFCLFIIIIRLQFSISDNFELDQMLDNDIIITENLFKNRAIKILLTRINGCIIGMVMNRMFAILFVKGDGSL